MIQKRIFFKSVAFCGTALLLITFLASCKSGPQEHFARASVLFQENWEEYKEGATPSSPVKPHGVEKGNSVTVKSVSDFQADRLGGKFLLIDDVKVESQPPPNAGITIPLPEPSKGPLLIEFDCAMSGTWKACVLISDSAMKPISLTNNPKPCGIALVFGCEWRRPHVVAISNYKENIPVDFFSNKSWFHVKVILPELVEGSPSTFQVCLEKPDGQTVSMNQLPFMNNIKDYGSITFTGYFSWIRYGQFCLDNIKITQLK